MKYSPPPHFFTYVNFIEVQKFNLKIYFLVTIHTPRQSTH